MAIYHLYLYTIIIKLLTEMFVDCFSLKNRSSRTDESNF